MLYCLLARTVTTWRPGGPNCDVVITFRIHVPLTPIQGPRPAKIRRPSVVRIRSDVDTKYDLFLCFTVGWCDYVYNYVYCKHVCVRVCMCVGVLWGSGEWPLTVFGGNVEWEASHNLWGVSKVAQMYLSNTSHKHLQNVSPVAQL